jgi:cell wall assembly regulator SMI1
MNPRRWVERWQAALAACQRLGGEVQPLQIEEPATVAEVHAVERKIGRELPTSLRQVLLEFSAGVRFRWSLPHRRNAPVPPEGPAWGGCGWDLFSLPSVEKVRDGWVKLCFADPLNPQHAVWHHKLPFQAVANGDLLALDLRPGTEAAVVYLSHEGDQEHGYLLGSDFADFLDRWSELGCPGPEAWLLAPFLAGPCALLDPRGPNAIRWKESFGMRG